MKTITTLLIATAASFSLNANANSFLSLDYSFGGGNCCPMSEQSIAVSPASTWSATDELSFLNETVEDEYNYIDPTSEQSIASVLNELDNNPPAAGSYSSSQISFLNETVEEEHQH